MRVKWYRPLSSWQWNDCICRQNFFRSFLARKNLFWFERFEAVSMTSYLINLEDWSSLKTQNVSSHFFDLPATCKLHHTAMMELLTLEDRLLNFEASRTIIIHCLSQCAFASWDRASLKIQLSISFLLRLMCWAVNGLNFSGSLIN